MKSAPLIPHHSIDDIEVELFIAAVHQKYEYDFSSYARASLKRRILSLTEAHKLAHISELIPVLLYDDDFISEILGYLSVQVSEMFRDPHVFKKLREIIMPMLATYPQINIWLAGCANGEEAYSLAILLKEENLLERSHIYATDISHKPLGIAREGIYSADNLESFEKNYLLAGGSGAFSDYYVSKYNYIHLQPELKKNIFFTDHNLACDGVFCEAHLVMCRNVMIYFDKELKNRSLSLFTDSLVPGGYLCIGTKEDISFTAAKSHYKALTQHERLFQKRF